MNVPDDAQFWAREVLRDLKQTLKNGYAPPATETTGFFGAVDEAGEACEYDSKQARRWTVGGALLKAEKKLPDSERLKFAPAYPCPHAKAACNALLIAKGLKELEKDQSGELELDAHAPSSQKEALDWLDKVLVSGLVGRKLLSRAVNVKIYDPFS